MKTQAHEKQQPTTRPEESGLGDIGRHLRASRLIAAREPLPTAATRSTNKQT